MNDKKDYSTLLSLLSSKDVCSDVCSDVLNTHLKRKNKELYVVFRCSATIYPYR